MNSSEIAFFVFDFFPDAKNNLQPQRQRYAYFLFIISFVSPNFLLSEWPTITYLIPEFFQHLGGNFARMRSFKIKTRDILSAQLQLGH